MTISLTLTGLQLCAQAEEREAESWSALAQDYERWGLAPEAADARALSRGHRVQAMSLQCEAALALHVPGGPSHTPLDA